MNVGSVEDLDDGDQAESPPPISEVMDFSLEDVVFSISGQLKVAGGDIQPDGDWA